MKYASVLIVSILSLLLVGIAPADSLNVRLIGSCDTPYNAMDVAVSGDYAYVTDGDSGLRVISIADPAHPVEVGRFKPSNFVHGLDVAGDYAYLAAGSNGLVVVSIADPSGPVQVGCCPAYWPEEVVVRGDYAYVADYCDGMKVISIADPTHPVEVGHCGSPECAYGVALSGSNAYVSDYLGGFWVISVVDPSQPTEVGHCGPIGGEKVTVAGNYAYLADLDSGLRVISVADPAHPAEVGHCATSCAWGVTVSGDYAYVGDQDAGLIVLSIADPVHPVERGYYDNTSGAAHCVAVDGGYIYVAGGFSGLQILEFYGAGVEESPNPQTSCHKLAATVIRTLPQGAVAFDAMGRRVSSPKPGVYFVGEGLGVGGRGSGRMRKVVLQR